MTYISILAAFENFSLNFIVKKQTAKRASRTIFHKKHSSNCGTIYQQQKQQRVIWAGPSTRSSHQEYPGNNKTKRSICDPAEIFPALILMWYISQSKAGGISSGLENENIKVKAVTDDTVSTSLSHPATYMHILRYLYLHTSYSHAYIYRERSPRKNIKIPFLPEQLCILAISLIFQTSLYTNDNWVDIVKMSMQK